MNQADNICSECCRDVRLPVFCVDGTWLTGKHQRPVNYCATCFPRRDSTPASIISPKPTIAQTESCGFFVHCDPENNYYGESHCARGHGESDAQSRQPQFGDRDYDYGSDDDDDDDDFLWHEYDFAWYGDCNKYGNSMEIDQCEPNNFSDDDANNCGSSVQSHDLFLHECYDGRPPSTALLLMELRNSVKFQKHLEYRIRYNDRHFCSQAPVSANSKYDLSSTHRLNIMHTYCDVEKRKQNLKSELKIISCFSERDQTGA